jgi:cyclase
MQVQKVSNTLHKFTLSFLDQPDSPTVNLAACVGQDGILLVDAGWAHTAERLNEKVRELGDGNAKLIIVTHPHRDHFEGSAFFGKEATLIAHQDARDELIGRYFALDKLPGQESPTILVNAELSLHFNGEEIRVIFAPGHTRSDMAVYFVNSGVVCLGDLLFSDVFPILDLTRGGDIAQYIESIGKLVALFPDDVTLIAGHGRDYTMDDLRELYRVTVDTTEVIKKGIADGKNAQDMIEADALKDWAKWSAPPTPSETWITRVYESLTGEAKQPISKPLTYTIVEKGIQAAIEQYQELKDSQPDGYDFGENNLNMLGYQLLWREMYDAAIQVFKLSIQVYPESANPYDSLGEAYMTIGDNELAIKYYEKALAVNPETPSAIDALERLRSASED